MTTSPRVPRRRRGPTRRSAFLSARVSDESRYQAELLSRYHEIPMSEVIEIALRQLAAKPTSDGGLGITVPAVRSDSYSIDDPPQKPKQVTLASETWSPDAWRRSYAMSRTCPGLLSRAEQDFWQAAPSDPRFRRPQTKEERAHVECEEDDQPVFEPELARQEWERRFGDQDVLEGEP